MYPNNESLAPKCDHCPTARALGARFCPLCGAKLPISHVQAPAADDRHDVVPKHSSADSETNSTIDEDSFSTVGEAAPSNGQIKPPAPPLSPEAPVPSGTSTTSETPELTRLSNEPNAQPMLSINGAAKQEPCAYRVVVRSPDGTQSTIPLENPLIIGKSDECDVTVPDDHYLSRQHARLEVAGNQVVIQDLNSSNGCFIRVKELTFLQPGDQVILGSTLLRIESRQPELVTRAG